MKYYVFNYYALENNYDNADKILEKIKDITKGKYYNENILITNTDKVIVDGKEIISNTTLEEFVKTYYRDTENTVKVYDDFEINQSEIADLLLEYFYKPFSDDKKPYEDQIGESDNPKDTIENILNQCLCVKLDILKDDIDVFMKIVSENGIKWN